jgi:branched-chain amino acid transport system permease protein
VTAAVLHPRRAEPYPLRIWIPFAVVVLILAAGPFVGLPRFLQSLVVEILMFSLLSLSLNVLLGYTGLVSLGHAAFFGVGGYALGIIASRFTPEIAITFPAAIAATVLLAIPVGWLSIRLSGFYFLMITFAFAQMAFVAAFRWKHLTGGSDGLIIPAPTLFGAPVLQNGQQFYLFTLAIFAMSCVAMFAIVHSQFGRALVGIRENTARMRAIGYNVRRYKLAAFLIGAAFAGVAGVLSALFNLFIAPESAHWTQSALVLVMVLIGGAGFFVGPIVGTAIVIVLQHWLSSYTEYWGLVLGLLFIILISGAREGVAGLIVQAYRRLQRKTS